MEHGVATASVPCEGQVHCQQSSPLPIPMKALGLVSYDEMHQCIKDFMPNLVKPFGCGKAHATCGRAHSIVAVSAVAGAKRDGDPGLQSVKALLSMSAAVAAEERDMVVWNDHCQLGKSVGKLQLRWLVVLPCAKERAWLQWVDDHKPAVSHMYSEHGEVNDNF